MGGSGPAWPPTRRTRKTSNRGLAAEQERVHYGRREPTALMTMPSHGLSRYLVADATVGAGTFVTVWAVGV